MWTNREATGAREIPESLVILGGGPVGVEMAQAFAALGTARRPGRGHGPHPSARAAAARRGAGEAIGGERLRIHLGRRAAAVAARGRPIRRRVRGRQRACRERLLVATGRRPRVAGLGLESVGIEPNPRGIPVDARMNAGEGVWAIGDVTGIWPLTYVGKYHGRIAAANILGEHREADYGAVPRVVFTHPQAAAVGAAEGALTATISLSAVPKTATYMRGWDEHPGFLTLISDGEVLTGAYGLGPGGGRVDAAGHARDPRPCAA